MAEAVDGAAARSGTESVTLYTSVRALLAAAVSPVLLAALGLRGIAVADGVPDAAVALLGLAGALLAYVVVAFPHRVDVDVDGITRVSVLRRHHLPWSEIRAIRRLPAPASRRVGAVLHRNDEPSPPGLGLVAERRRPPARRVRVGPVRPPRRGRQVLLTDQRESAEEHDRLLAVMARAGVDARLLAGRPEPGSTPTSLYRPGRT